MDRKDFKLGEVKHKCPICKRMYSGYGHNGLPVWPGRVCDRCHRDYVVPMRLALVRQQQKENKG